MNLEDKFSHPPLAITISQHNTSFVETILNQLIHLLKLNPSRHPIFSDAEFGSSLCLQILFSYKLSEIYLYQYCWRSVLKAAENHNFECIRLLLQYLANPETTETKTPLRLVLNNNSESIRQYINANYDNLNKSFLSDWILLHIAVVDDHFQFVYLLLSQPLIDMNTTDSEFYIALRLLLW